MNIKNIIETKVIAGFTGAGGGAAVGTFLLWLLGVTFWHQSASAGDASTAVAAVPGPVSALLLVVVSAAGSYLGGYLAPHTERPDLTAKAIADALASPAPAAVQHAKGDGTPQAAQPAAADPFDGVPAEGTDPTAASRGPVAVNPNPGTVTPDTPYITGP